MKHLTSLKTLAAVAVALGAFAAASSAQARSDVVFSVGLQLPGVYVQPTPVYLIPRPNVYDLPAPQDDRRFDGGRHHEWQHWQGQGAWRDHEHGGVVSLAESGGPRHLWRQVGLHGPYGDMDRDGIRNQYDRDRDGDGIRNRVDRFPNSPNRR
jgi:hypothetical protein